MASSEPMSPPTEVEISVTVDSQVVSAENMASANVLTVTLKSACSLPPSCFSSDAVQLSKVEFKVSSYFTELFDYLAAYVIPSTNNEEATVAKGTLNAQSVSKALAGSWLLFILVIFPDSDKKRPSSEGEPPVKESAEEDSKLTEDQKVIGLLLQSVYPVAFRILESQL